MATAAAATTTTTTTTTIITTNVATVTATKAAANTTTTTATTTSTATATERATTATTTTTETTNRVTDTRDGISSSSSRNAKQMLLEETTRTIVGDDGADAAAAAASSNGNGVGNGDGDGDGDGVGADGVDGVDAVLLHINIQNAAAVAAAAAAPTGNDATATPATAAVADADADADAVAFAVAVAVDDDIVDATTPAAAVHEQQKQNEQEHKQQQQQQDETEEVEEVEETEEQLEEEQEVEPQFDMDDIPEPIKVLDDIISEFDGETTKPAALLGNSNSGENQSEDDGYMSLSRKNMSKKDSDDVAQTPSTDTVPEGSFNEADATLDAGSSGTAENIARLETEMAASVDAVDGGVTSIIVGVGIDVGVGVGVGESVGVEQLIQTTLPKARTANTAPVANTNYSSLPCCGARNNAAHAHGQANAGHALEAKTRTGSCNGERNALGIDISAVHNAVLRGNLAKLPEPMLNEHPVTIYPGPSTKSAAEGGGVRNKRHQLINSVEQHKEVCHMLNPHSSSSSSSTSNTATTTTTNSSSSGEASPAASQLNVSSAKALGGLVGMQKQKPKQKQAEDIYSEDSLEEEEEEEEEESTISTDITPIKQNGIAWEIYFKGNNNKKKHSKTGKTCTKSSTKKSQPRPDATLTSINSLYNANNMLGKGTFVIRRSAAKKPTRVADIFTVPQIGDTIYTSDSELSEAAPPTSAAITTTAAGAAAAAAGTAVSLTTVTPAEANFVYKECEAAAATTRRSLEMAAAQRAAIASPRERLSLNIEAPHQASLDRATGVQVLAHNAIISPEEHSKPLKKVSLQQVNEKRLSAESMPDNTSSSEEFDEVRLNGGNGYDIFPYNANGMKPQEYEHRTSNTTTPHTDLAPTLEEDEELSDFSYGCGPLKQIENNISALLRGDIPVARISAVTGAVGMATGAANAIDLPLASAKRALEFRPGVHKSESAKEMLLSQNILGPLPPSPPSSNPDLFDYDAPLPPSPVEVHKKHLEQMGHMHQPLIPPHQQSQQMPTFLKTNTTVVEVHAPASSSIAAVAGVAASAGVPPITINNVMPMSKLDSARRSRDNVSALRHFNDELPPPPPAPAVHKTSFEVLPPAVPPHRGYGGAAGLGASHSANTMKSWSIDSNYRKKSPKMLGYSSSGITTPTGGGPMAPLPPPPIGATATSAGSYESGSYTRRYVNYGTKRSLKQSPREEHRLQTSCSLPETPIFARGCDIPRTPYRRQNEPPAVSGSRTAPRSSTSNSINMGTSIVGIGGGHYGTSQMCRQRSINHALASNEMLRMTGAPARGWYPKQRSMRPVSTENIDRLSSVRVWDNPAGMSGTGQSRKPLTLPPNLTPSFLHKSPREALRRVTSLLITKKKSPKERKHKAYSDHTMDPSDKHVYEFDTGSTKRKDNSRNANTANSNANSNPNTNTNTKKKKGLFKTLWKRTKHVSLDQ